MRESAFIGHSFRLHTAIFLACLAALASGALVLRPDTAAAQSQARAAQFLFVIDDSGSMSGRNATDPDRLAVFSVHAILSMLDDRDEVSLIRLNGDAAEDPDIQPLAQNRRQMEGLLALDGPTAQYRGQWTPCRSAMERAKVVLNRAYRPEVHQAVMFLTDGACEPAGEDPRVDTLLDDLSAHRDGRFQFYFLRFAGRKYSKNLSQLAANTKGNSIEVGPGDPATILYPFATALSRSQGYEAYVLSPRDNTLKAHRGARRIRLLAVAPDEGSDLSISLSARGQGAPSRIMGRPRSGVHQYQSGRRFRYTAVDYAPSESGSVVSVTGAANWKVIIFPEYRLILEQKVLQGACGQGTQSAQSIDVGQDICAVLRLVNDEGSPVSDLGNEAAGFVGYQSPSGRTERVRANREGADLAFVMGRSRLQERGRHTLSPILRLTFPDRQAVELQGTPWEVDVSTDLVNCSSEPIDAGEMVPGSDVLKEFACSGNFPPTSARLVVQDASSLPPCLRFDINGETEGIVVSVDQPYSLGIHADPFCGPTSINRAYDVVLRLEFAQGARRLPAQTLQVRLQLTSEFACSFRPANSEMEGGSERLLELECSTNAKKTPEFLAVLPESKEGGTDSWNRDFLKAGFADKDGRMLHDNSGNPLRKTAHRLSVDGSGDSLRLLVVADRCCDTSEHLIRAVLIPAGQGFNPSHAVRLPVEVSTRSAGLLKCWGRTILWLLLGLLLLLLALYVFFMIRNSSFLNVETLASKLQPLVWTTTGTALLPKSKDGVRQHVKRSLKTGARIANWFRANPLAFGLPGRAFVETIQIVLVPKKDPAQGLSLSLVPRARQRMLTEEKPEAYAGNLFAEASGGDVAFFGVPKPPAGHLATLCLEENIALALSEAAADEAPKCRSMNIRKKRLVKALEVFDRNDGDAAGWMVG